MSVPRPIYLADGQLANAKATIFTAAVNYLTMVSHLTLFNTDTVTLLCKIYLNGGTSRQMREISLPSKEHYTVFDELSKLYLDPGDLIEGEAATAAKVNYFIFGYVQLKGGAS